MCADCASACERSCVDCLQTFRNAYYHRFLNRQLIAEVIEEAGHDLTFEHDIPARLPIAGADQTGLPVNEAEATLKGMLGRAGFREGQWQRQIQLGPPLGTTRPDCYYELDGPEEPGICIYLAGLSEHIHGNPATQHRDRQIRETLESTGYWVFEIAASQLADRGAMVQHFAELARILMGQERASDVRGAPRWFKGESGIPGAD